MHRLPNVEKREKKLFCKYGYISTTLSYSVFAWYVIWFHIVWWVQNDCITVCVEQSKTENRRIDTIAYFIRSNILQCDCAAWWCSRAYLLSYHFFSFSPFLMLCPRRFPSLPQCCLFLFCFECNFLLHASFNEIRFFLLRWNGILSWKIAVK